MRIYNEKEKVKEEKIQHVQHVQFEKKRGTRKYNHIKEKPDAKCNKGSSDLRARPHFYKLLDCEKK